MESNCNSDNIHEKLDDIWEWQEDEYCLQSDSQLGTTECLWDNVDQNEDNVLYMLEDHTPIKECGELRCDILDSVDKSKKSLETSTESSTCIRRRTLQFDSDVNETLLDSLTQKYWQPNINSDSQWCSSVTDDKFLFSDKVIDQPAEMWYQDCFTGTEMCSSSSRRNGYTNVDDQANVSAPERQTVESPTPAASTIVTHKGMHRMTSNARIDMPKPLKTSIVKILKGRKSNISAPTKSTTSVTYPFNLIKPFEHPGNLSLNDINKRIHAPPPKSKDTDAGILYPTSAFSGKPVINKTKIQTEGGKGSITILRTKG